MSSIETYHKNSGISEKRNGFKSANLALKIADKMKEIFQEHIGSNEEKTTAEHLLHVSTLRTAKDRQDSEISDMQKENGE